MNEIITTSQNDQGEIIISGRELHEFLEKKLWKEMGKKIEAFIDNLIELSFNGDWLKDAKHQLLKVGVETYDYFNLIALDAYLESLYLLNVIDEDLTDNKRIPNGSDNQYGRFFEKRILEVLAKYMRIKSKQYKSTDAIGSCFNTDYIIEIKCGKTDTEQQIQKYQKVTGIKNFITVNGHANSISFTHLDVYRISKYITLNKMSQIKRWRRTKWMN